MPSTPPSPKKNDKGDEALPPEPLIIITPHAKNPQADADEGKGGILERLAILTRDASNLSPVSILLLRLLIHHDVNIIPSNIEIEKREGLLTSLVSIASSDKQTIIVLHFYKYGAATQPELFYKFAFNWPMIGRTIKKLVSCEIIEKVGYVGLPYRPPGKPGPPVPIYALVGVDPKAAKEAQIRYAETHKKLEPEKVDTFKREMEQREAQREARELEITNYVKSIYDAIPRPLTDKSTPIYEEMTKQGVPDDLRKAVTKRVLARCPSPARTLALETIQEAEARGEVGKNA